ncbi:MAG: chemotaxis protein CheW [Bacillota bacterium]
MQDREKETIINQNDLHHEEDTQKGKFLTFQLEKESYGVEVRYVTEIIGLQSITPMPDLPCYIKGIINLRGRIIPVMDVRLRFNMLSKEYDDRTCIIVTDINENPLGLIVDQVTEVVNIGDEDLVPPPNFHQSSQNKFLKSIGKKGSEVKLILDCDKLLADDIKEDLHIQGDTASAQ